MCIFCRLTLRACIVCVCVCARARACIRLKETGSVREEEYADHILILLNK